MAADPASDTRPPRRVALAGAGMISHYHLVAWSRLAGRVEVVAIADPDRTHAAARAATFGIPRVETEVAAMLAGGGIDVLDIASPRETHAENVMLAAERGIPVLCQKPLTPTLALSQALVRRLGERVRLMVHENWRFRPWYRAIAAWRDEGALGRPLAGQMAMLTSGMLPDADGRRPALERQPFMAFEQRLLIAETLIHHLDVLRWLFGPLRVVGARATRTLAEVRGETLAAIFLETAEGAPVTLTGTMVAPGFPSRTLDRFEYIGSAASAVLDGTALRRLGAAPAALSFDFDESYQASFDGVIRHFVQCLDSGAPFETDPMDNLETLRLVEHAYWAAGLHQPAAEPGAAP